MPTPLAPCPGCSRHVRALETACPFCGSTLDAQFRAAAARRTSTPARRLGRAALFAFGSAVASSGCYEHHLRAPEAPGIGPVDAAFNADAALPDAVDAGTDAAIPSIALYGAPPDPVLDAGALDDLDGAVFNLYGAAPAPHYGAPPEDET